MILYPLEFSFFRPLSPFRPPPKSSLLPPHSSFPLNFYSCLPISPLLPAFVLPSPTCLSSRPLFLLNSAFLPTSNPPSPTRLPSWPLFYPPHLSSFYLLPPDLSFLLANLPFQALSVTTLTLGSRPRQGLVRLRAKKEAQEWRKVWGNEPSHSQRSFHFGGWSPGGLLNVQRTIARVKNQWLNEFFITLKTYWNLDV